MKSQLPLFSFLVFFIHASFAQSPPALQWEKCMGGSGDDFTRSLELTNDGGFIFSAGVYSSDGDVTGNHGIADVWLVKADANGTIQWQKCYGGKGADLGWAIKQTADGGYFLANNSLSKNGDVTGNHGSHDFWEVKTDASGNIQWEKSYGGSDYDAPYAAEQTTDHGYMVVGSSESNDGNVTGAHGFRDGWVIKLDSSGNLQWQRALGGTQGDDIFAVSESSDGGYIVAGGTYSNDGNVSGNHGTEDVWLVKLNGAGIIQWQHCYGGAQADEAKYIEQTPDGGYVVSGHTRSNDGDVSGDHGTQDDIWVFKINSTGILQWQKCLGGSGDDYGRWIEPTDDGGYLVMGATGSSDGDVTVNHGDLDYWIAKLDSSRNIQWQKSVGGSLEDYGYVFDYDGAGNYYLGGYTESNDGDVSGNHGGDDIWVVKLSSPACNFLLSTAVNDQTCAGNNGSIDLTASGGTSPYTYHWSNGATTQDIIGLTAGIYTVTVTDAGGCAATSNQVQVGASSFDTPINLFTTDITTTTATLRWNIVGAPSGFGIRYKLTSSDIWKYKTIPDGTKTSYPLTGLSPASHYEWQISENCSSQNSSSSYSFSSKFVTKIFKEAGSMTADNFQLSIYPNPAEDFASIHFAIPAPSHVYILVYDLSGKEIETVLNDNVEPGDHSLLLNTTHFSKGVYLVKMISDSGIDPTTSFESNQKLIVQ